jgi:hypothetical protein
MEGHHPTGPEPILNVQYYQPKKNPSKLVPTLPSSFMPVITPGPYPDFRVTTSLPPIIKNYNISMDGPSGDHIAMSRIYEDALPLSKIKDTFSTINDRLTIHSHIRNSLFGNRDGTDTTIDGSGESSILHYLKFDSMNPYYYEPKGNNPYKYLPHGFTMYRSCYPIIKDASGFTSCAKDSINVNVKCYMLTESSYNNFVEKENLTTHDEWREIAFYEYVREMIIKKKVSPNFVFMYGYFISLNSKIGYAEMDKIKGVHFPDTDNYKGKSIVSLSESPTYRLSDWASKLTTSVGTITKTITTGVHLENEWFSVLFQLLTAIYVMQIYGIKFNNFSLEHNVFIKDISKENNMTTYWKYKINGIDYYIPNDGFVLLIDSNFRDLDYTSTTVLKTDKTESKINGSFLKHANFEDDMTDMLKHALQFDIFKNAPDNFMKVVGIMRENIKEKNISWYIQKYMTRFMNNRIGTFLKTDEISNIKQNESKDFHTGEIVVHKSGNGQLKFAMFLNSTANGHVNILTELNQNSEKSVPAYSIVKYSLAESIVQTFKPNEAKMNEDDLLETYIINEN